MAGAGAAGVGVAGVAGEAGAGADEIGMAIGMAIGMGIGIETGGAAATGTTMDGETAAAGTVTVAA